MPIYFGDVAPYCPTSNDQWPGFDTTGGWPTQTFPIRTVIPRAYDLPSAIAAVNIARSIVIQIVRDKVINNVHRPSPPKPRKPGKDRTIDKTRTARWHLRGNETVKMRYKYYAKDERGDDIKDTWIITERIEHMAWSDPGWRTRLDFVYKTKSTGELLGVIAGGTYTPAGEASGG